MVIGWWFVGGGGLMVVAALVLRVLKRRYYRTWNRCAGHVVAVSSREQLGGETGPVTAYRPIIEFENAQRTPVRFEGSWGGSRRFSKVGATVPVMYLDPRGGDARIDEVGPSWEKALAVTGTCHVLFGLLMALLE